MRTRLLLPVGGCVAALAGTLAAAQPGVPRAAYDPDRGAIVLELGPVDLPAGGHDAVDQPRPLEVALPADGWLQGFALEVVDREGRAVPRRVIHHVNVMQPDRRELFSPVMLRLAAAGQETPDVHLPWFLGIPVARGGRVLATAMLHNPTAQDFRGVRLRIRLAFRPVDAWPAASPVMPFYLDVVPHGAGHAWDLPPGRSERSWEGRPAVSGRIVGLSGHLHRHGVLIRLEDLTTGRLVWEARPRTDASGEVEAIPVKRFGFARPTLDAAHVYRLTAVYDNPTGDTIPGGAMGALGGIVVPEHSGRWPAADPRDEAYARDLAFTLAANGGSAHGAGGHAH